MNTIPLQPVVSSNIQAIGHDGDKLAIQFKGGRVYHYEGVPADVFDEMRADGASVGSKFATLVRPKFEGSLIEDPKAKKEDDEQG